MDWNSDGRKDLVIGEGDGQVRIYLNVGTDANPSFNGYTQLQVGGATFDCVCSAVPWVVDWDNDGRKDVVCGAQSGRVYLMLNTGTDSNPVFTASPFLLNGTSTLGVGADSCPVVVDWNADGKKDLIVGAEAGTLTYFENKGTDAAPLFSGYELFRAGEATLDVNYNAHPTICDWDNDGRLDVICGDYELTSTAHVVYFRKPDGVHLSLCTVAGIYEPGSVVNLNCTVRNSGLPATNVTVSLSSASPWGRVVQPSWSVGDMPTDATKNNGTLPFRFWIETNALLGVTVPLTLVVSADGGASLRTNEIRFDVAKPNFSVAGFLVNDSQGNGNCALDPGENGQLIVRLKNTGYRAENVTARMYYAYGVTVTHPNSSFGNIERNATNANSLLPFGLTALSSVPALPYFAIEVTCNRATFTNYFSMQVQPEYPRSNGVSFAWIDTTGGTTLALANDGYASISTPFSFRLYEYTFSYLYLSANGYLSVNSSGSAINSSLPSTAYPNGMFAPFWDDLDPSAGGVLRYKFFGSSPSRYLVAEWNNVPRRSDLGSLVTFQAIIYENGDIKYQYGNCTGTNADGRSATIGIEDYYGYNGKQYAFNQVGAVSNGLALYFRCSAGSDDTDGDGLPDAYERFYFSNLTSSGTQDSDGDGVCNNAEFRAGTDPRTATSCLRCQPVQILPPNKCVLRWCSIPGRSYRVWQSTNAGAETWTLLTPQAITGAASGFNSYTGTVSSATSPRFWRVSTP